MIYKMEPMEIVEAIGMWLRSKEMIDDAKQTAFVNFQAERAGIFSGEKDKFWAEVSIKEKK